MSITTHRIILTGLGNVGRSFLEIMSTQGELLRERYGIALALVGAADSGGAAYDPAGLDVAAVLGAKRAGTSVASLPGSGVAKLSGLELLQRAQADFLLEATPVSLSDGQPGLDTVRAALAGGVHAVLANKGPLALAYPELAAISSSQPGELAQTGRPALRFSACVGGALPSVNIGWRDLVGSQIARIESVLNSTTQGILRMIEAESDYATALAEMQRRGLAETDPTLDVDGWDSACKTVILANAVLRQPCTLADISVAGIRDLAREDLLDAKQRGERIMLLGLAEREGAGYRLSVRPTALPADHPLARMTGEEMGIVYHTDIAGVISATILQRGPIPTAAAMLRDMIEVIRG